MKVEYKDSENRVLVCLLSFVMTTTFCYGQRNWLNLSLLYDFSLNIDSTYRSNTLITGG